MLFIKLHISKSKLEGNLYIKLHLDKSEVSLGIKEIRLPSDKCKTTNNQGSYHKKRGINKQK